jgi:hypothetical protein
MTRKLKLQYTVNFRVSVGYLTFISKTKRQYKLKSQPSLQQGGEVLLLRNTAKLIPTFE